MGVLGSVILLFVAREISDWALVNLYFQWAQMSFPSDLRQRGSELSRHGPLYVLILVLFPSCPLILFLRSVVNRPCVARDVRRVPEMHGGVKEKFHRVGGREQRGGVSRKKNFKYKTCLQSPKGMSK